MINIKYKKNINEQKIPFGRLEDGYYLIESIYGNRVIVLSIAGDMAHFHKNSSSRVTHARCKEGDYFNFYLNYMMLGKIKDFDITNIKLEE